MPSPHSSFAKGTIQTGHLQVLGETGLAEGVLVETAKVSQHSANKLLHTLRLFFYELKALNERSCSPTW